MARFKPLKHKTVVAGEMIINGKEVQAVAVYDDSLSTVAQRTTQIDRIIRNDTIVEDVFNYVDELRLSPDALIKREDVITKLRDVIISDYPVEVRTQ